MQRRVPITEAQRELSYAKYYDEEIVAPPRESLALIQKGPIDPAEALPISERNRLFEPGYLEAEIGFCIMPDGTGYVANLTRMPGVTAEMFDWWFAWHGLDSLRYKIWDREDHMYCQTRNPEQARDPKLSYKEKYWNTRHDVIEAFGPEPKEVVIPFIPPQNMGFDPEKLKDFKGTIVAMAAEDNRTISCHFVQPVEGGVELYSRFWFGWHLKDGHPERFDDKIMPEQLPKALLLHNIKEFTNLARLLPRIFPEERDNF